MSRFEIETKEIEIPEFGHKLVEFKKRTNLSQAEAEAYAKSLSPSSRGDTGPPCAFSTSGPVYRAVNVAAHVSERYSMPYLMRHGTIEPKEETDDD